MIRKLRVVFGVILLFVVTSLSCADVKASSQSSNQADEIQELQFGDNLLQIGDEINDTREGHNLKVSGLMFQVGNNIKTQADTEYSFIVGNSIQVLGKINKDAFILGSNIEINQNAQLGGGLYAAGSEIVIKSDINHDLAIFAREVHLDKDVKIHGEVNLYAEKITFGDNVQIEGGIKYNDDAELIGYSNIKHTGELQSYHTKKYQFKTTDYLLWKLYGAVTLIVVMVIVLLLFPKIYPKIKDTFTNSSEMIKNALIGVSVFIGVPVLSVFLLLSLFGIPLGLLLLGIYIITIYLAQGFAGLWIGNLIITGLLKTKSNPYLEVVIGIIVLTVLSVAPYFGSVIKMLSLLTGIGIIIYATRNKQNA